MIASAPDCYKYLSFNSVFAKTFLFDLVFSHFIRYWFALLAKFARVWNWWVIHQNCYFDAYKWSALDYLRFDWERDEIHHKTGSVLSRVKAAAIAGKGWMSPVSPRRLFSDPFADIWVTEFSNPGRDTQVDRYNGWPEQNWLDADRLVALLDNFISVAPLADISPRGISRARTHLARESSSPVAGFFEWNDFRDVPGFRNSTRTSYLSRARLAPSRATLIRQLWIKVRYTGRDNLVGNICNTSFRSLFTIRRRIRFSARSQITIERRRPLVLSRILFRDNIWRVMHANLRR